jgi:hypothetical protein
MTIERRVGFAPLAALLLTSGGLPAADCNGNGILDDEDLFPRPEFGRFSEPVVGPLPAYVLTADLDGDGDLDLATANRRSATVADRHGVNVLLNEKQDGFGARVEYRVTYEPSSPVASDLDGDGDLDLAVVHTARNGGVDDRVSLLINTGGAFFAPAVEKEIEIGARDLTAGDLDADGDVDLTAAQETGKIAVLRNQGGGSFEIEHFPAADKPMLIAVLDIDGDVDLDLAVVAQQASAADRHRLWIYRNDGTELARGEPQPLGKSSSEMQVGDLDGDGWADLAVTDHDGGTPLFFGRPPGVFERRATLPSTRAFGLALGDVNGDGSLDVVGGDVSTPGVEVFLNRGGAFGEPLRESIRSAPFSIATGDLDGDGDLELAAVQADAFSLSILWNECVAGFRNAVQVPLEIPAAAMTFVDLVADGLPDLVLAGGMLGGSLGSVNILANDRGRFLEPDTYLAQTHPGSVLAADLNADGSVDLVTTHWESDDLFVFKNRGDGRFALPARPKAGPDPVAAVTGDFDRDGDLDIAALNQHVEESTGGVTVLWNDGAAALTPSPDAILLGRDPSALAVVDTDAEGSADLVVTGGLEGRLWLLQNDGGGGFAPRLEAGLGSRPVAIVAADLNGDGPVDLAAVNAESMDVWILPNDGHGRFPRVEGHPVGERPGPITAADLNGNGDVDLAVANAMTSDVSVLWNLGSGAFGIRQDLLVAAQPGSIFATDLEGDGDLDLATFGSSYAVLSLILNVEGCKRSRDCDRNGIPDECDIAEGRATDGDADGIPDLCRRAPFHRGDITADGTLDISDPIRILSSLFQGQALGFCRDAADANDDGNVDLSDAVHILAFLYQGARPPPRPGPPGSPCGEDPHPPGSEGSLGCDAYAGCS